MEQDKVKGRILAIDTVSHLGSVAVVQASSVLASSERASGNPARAEQLLLEVTRVLESIGMKFEDLEAVAVAAGPGSYSGIRIGVATAMGFSSAQEITALGVSLLDALAILLNSGERGIAAVRAGRNDIAFQEFTMTDSGPHSLSPPIQDSETNFLNELPGSSPTVVCDNILADLLRKHLPQNVDLRGAGSSLAGLIGQFAAKFPDRSQLRPIYLRSRAHNASGF